MPIKHIVFFGDSLTDNGNLYELLLKILPKSPPYFKGRFSNGYTWAELVGKYFYDKEYIDYQNYALGGATAVFHIPTDKFIAPTTLELEVNKYLAESILQNKSTVLFSIWIGGNDYLFGQEEDINIATDKVVNKTIEEMKWLIVNGAKYFMVFNMPDFSYAPIAQNNPAAYKWHTLAILHNEKLSAQLSLLKKSFPHIQINFIDVFSLFKDLLENPEKYNQKYHLKLKNLLEACWKGGFTLKNALKETGIRQELEKTIMDQDKVNNLVYLLKNTPFYSYTYSSTELYNQGMVPCENADEYVFWDQIHPTQTMHVLLAYIVEEELTKQFSLYAQGA